MQDEYHKYLLKITKSNVKNAQEFIGQFKMKKY